MPRKAFVADLQQAQTQSPHASVSDIKRGEDDGSFVFKVAPSDGTKAIEVTAMIPELSDYPSEHLCFLYTSSDGVSESISNAISGLDVQGQKIANIITATATVICAKRGVKRQHSAEDADVMEIDSDYGADPEDDDEEEDFAGSDNDDDDGSIGGWSPAMSDDGLAIGDSQVAGSTDPMASEYIKEFCADLRAAKNAGFKVGVLGALPGGSGYLVVSIRISKLGISDEAMTAWRLNPEKYLVLLMHFPAGYKPLAAMAKDSYNAKKWLQVYVGTSSRYKPSLQEAITAFTKVKKFKEDQDGNIHVFKGEGGKLDVHGLSDSQADKSSTTFEGTFISRPISDLLNERLLALALYRVSYGFGWDGAEMFYEDFQGRERTDQVDEKYYQEDNGLVNLARIVQGDALKANLTSNKDISFPLIAIQYMLRHFVRCTEFCLVCHNKINANFEALKPYVCSKPLCLYQYMALGFGPSMEYEILDQPSVIDLLISFCFVSAAQGRLTDFPLGLNLTVPLPGTLPYSAYFNRNTQELTANVFEGDTMRLNTGDWIVMTPAGSVDTVHCRVVEGEYWPKARLAIQPSPSSGAFLPEVDTDGNPISIQADPTFPVNYCIYRENFDELSEQVRRNSILQMLETLPSVNEMKEWLILNTKVGEEASLKTWKNRISPPALLLLRWIVASNRSCIVQIDETPDDPIDYNSTTTPPDIASTTDEIKDKGTIIGEERVHGMDGWIQFRFAMGAPDKEQRFVNEVRTAVETSGLTYPTLFAFHGSPLQNWHSIIREGLHFRETVHGRAYGHGVYHSLDASVSLGYTNSYRSYNYNSSGSNSRWWSKSHLCINSAMCLNEIVNLPDKFVSKSPHLVVDKVDWIQSRYLFVQTARSPSQANAVAASAPVPAHPLPQDPAMTPKGTNHKQLVIPETASTVRTRSGNNVNISQSTGQVAKKSRTGFSKIKNIVKMATGSFTDPILLDDGYASVVTDSEDLEILFIDEKPKGKGKEVASKGSEKKPPKKKNPNAFVPGTLDTSQIQLLAEPAYASPMATKRIQQELKSLLKIQESHDLDELGWYIDQNLIDNVYQWLLEIHSFDAELPIAEDMKKLGVKSIVMEVRFGKDFPMTPPFFRVIKPRFRPFAQKGGGHVTAGGALCMELLTNSGWSAVSSLESVLLQIKMAMSSTDPYPARLEGGANGSYSAYEAKDAFVRACRTHGWQVPPDFSSII